MPLHFDLESLVHWRAFISLAWLIFLLTWESVRPFLHQFTAWQVRGRHGARNLVLGWVNALATAVLFAWLWRMVATWADTHHFGLLHWIGERSGTPGVRPSEGYSWPSWLRAVAAVLLFDMWTYWWHRTAHAMPWLWRFHRMHHSDPHMDVTTANRFHPGEILMSSVLRLAVIPLLGLRFGEVVLYETLLQVLVQFHHANVALPGPMERLLRALIVTPILHKIHHSRLRPETDSNFASLFSFWDRWFGSFRLRPDPADIRFGLEGEDDDSRQTLRALWKTPWN